MAIRVEVCFRSMGGVGLQGPPQVAEEEEERGEVGREGQGGAGPRGLLP